MPEREQLAFQIVIPVSTSAEVGNLTFYFGIGISFQVPFAQQLSSLVYLTTLSEVAACKRVEGTSQSLNLWFRGPRVAGDFLSMWLLPLPERSAEQMTVEYTTAAD